MLGFETLTLAPIEGFLLSRVDGQAKVRDVLAQVPQADDEAAARFLFGLLILGLVTFAPAISAGPLSCRDLVRGEEEKKKREDRERSEVTEFYRVVQQGTPQTILGITEEATQERVKTAYLERKE